MSYADLNRAIFAAADIVDLSIRRGLPSASSRLLSWRSPASLAAGAVMDLGFPVYQLPYWLSAPDEYRADFEFYTDLASSTMYFYMCVRMVDDVADGDVANPPKELLPAVAFLQSQGMHRLQRYFSADHSVWAELLAVCGEQADATIADMLLSDVQIDRFLAVSAHKANAAKIPIVAAAHRRERSSMAEPWCGIVEQLGAVHQLWNDVMGACSDRRHGMRTLVLCRYETRAAAKESLESWLIREGVDWAWALIASWMRGAEEAATAAGSAVAAMWAQNRSIALERDFSAMKKALEAGSGESLPPSRSAPMGPWER